MMAEAGFINCIQIILLQRTKPVQTPFTPAEEMRFHWPVNLVDIIFVVTVQLELGGVMIYHSTNTCEFSFKMVLTVIISSHL